VGVMLSECEMPQEAKENKTRSRGTQRNELHPSGVHDSDESVSQGDVRSTRVLGYQCALFGRNTPGQEGSADICRCACGIQC